MTKENKIIYSLILLSVGATLSYLITNKISEDDVLRFERCLNLEEIAVKERIKNPLKGNPIDITVDRGYCWDRFITKKQKREHPFHTYLNSI